MARHGLVLRRASLVCGPPLIRDFFLKARESRHDDLLAPVWRQVALELRAPAPKAKGGATRWREFDGIGRGVERLHAGTAWTPRRGPRIPLL